jgi:hypothetical protein
MLLAGAALFLLTYGLLEGQPYHWGTVATLAGLQVTVWIILVAGAVALLALVAWDRTRPAPLLPPRLFRNPDFSGMALVAILVSVATFGLFLPLTVYLQSVQDYTALATALTLLPISLLSAAMAPITGRLADWMRGGCCSSAWSCRPPASAGSPGMRTAAPTGPSCCPAPWPPASGSAAPTRPWARSPCATSSRCWPGAASSAFGTIMRVGGSGNDLK